MTSALTGALLHFIWQGLLVFVLLRAALFLLRDRSANMRYAVACASLAILAMAPAITAAFLYHPTALIAAPPIATTAMAVAVSAPAARGASGTAALRPWILPLWAFGVAVCSLRMLWACGQVAALRRRSAPAAAAIQETVSALSRRLGVSRRARVLISTWPGGPSVVGWLRPVILLPAAAIAGLTPEQLEAVLAHELAHIRRHDYLVNWLQLAVETLLFYHPAVWWISSRIRDERELCCDDLAVAACAEPVCYARALTILEKLRATTPATALAGTGGPLLYRIQRIVGAAPSAYGPSRASGVAAVVVAVAFLGVTLHWTRAQSQPTPDYLRMGDTLLRAGSHDLALEKYREGMRLHPDERATYQKRTMETLILMQRKQEAYNVNDELLREHPTDTDALNTAEAIRILQSVIERVPENPVAHLNLGLAYAAQKQLDLARQEIEEAIQLRPDFTRARTELARIEDAPPPQEEKPTIEFLRDEVKNAQEKLAALRQQSASEPEVREAESDVNETRHRLQMAENAIMMRLAVNLREKKLEQAKAAGDDAAARQLQAQIQHAIKARELQAVQVEAMLRELELRLSAYQQQRNAQATEAMKHQIEALRQTLEDLKQRLEKVK
jgi:beta-lactamase regulating signal transducer with metallopeptidase domain/Flp pilus assembly protein TadD